MTKKKLVVVDADTLVYRSAVASEQRSILVKHKPTGIEKSFTNRTELKALLKSKNKLDRIQEYSITDIQEPEPIENCLHNIKVQAGNIIDMFSDSEVIFVAGDKNNFRLDLPLPTRYKSNRDSMLRPVHLAEAREYFVKKFKALSADGYEVDDLSIILAYEGLNKGKEAILAACDKDAKQAVGLKLFDYTNPDKPIVHIRDWHEMNLVKGDFKSYGVPFLCYQLIRGDKIDCITPYELTGKSFGDTGAYKLLSNCNTAKQCLEVVADKFQEWYPEPVTYLAWDKQEYTKDWKQLLQLYFSSIYMLRKHDDETTVEQFFDSYGVKL
jgi:hypothetical protein